MDVVERERQHLAEAAAKQQVERQKRVINKLVQDGHDTRAATSLLDAMERGLEGLGNEQGSAGRLTYVSNEKRLPKGSETRSLVDGDLF